QSKIMTHLQHLMYTSSKERERILRNVGERIFRPMLSEVGDVRITMLGSAREVGRSAILVQTRESQVLLDCGINPGATKPLEAFPRLDAPQFDIESLDAVVISHAHLDHCGLLPYLFKYGYDGPVYCSAPNVSLMTLLQLDYLDVLSRQGMPLPYDQKDVREVALHAIPLRYGVVTDIAPDIRLTLHNAGHILGSSIVHLHIGEGYHNIVYTGDFKYGRTMLLEAAATEFPRVETIITENTYSAPTDIMPSRAEAEKNLVSVINETIERGGKVMIPVPAVGRAQEIMLVIDDYMRRGELKEAPVFIEGMISESTAIHMAYPEYLSKEVRNKIINEGINPFESEYFTIVEHPSARSEIIEGEPCIILATSGMLEGGPIIDYFQNLAEDERNALVFVSYQIEGTLGRRIQRGAREVSIVDQDGKIRVIKVGLKVHTVEGFSGHSDRRQIINYLRKIAPKPENIIICHGERSKCLALADFLHRRYKVNAIAPDILETIKLR
ncbi:MAG: beta-CASP ribonuclease aCPSF1, partial [Candidatus Bathyarchaeia archaeon]